MANRRDLAAAEREIVGRILTAVPGAVIGELSDYSDYGIQEYGTSGWDADPNYTAQPTNATHTTHRFNARTQDPQTGTWTSQDTWR